MELKFEPKAQISAKNRFAPWRKSITMNQCLDETVIEDYDPYSDPDYAPPKRRKLSEKPNPEKVLAVVPIILIPQIMLAGLVAKIGSSTVELVSYLTFTRWGIEGFGNIQGEILHEGNVNKSIEILKISFHNSYQENFDSSGSLTLDFIAIMTLVIIMFILIYFTLKRKDSI